MVDLGVLEVGIPWRGRGAGGLVEFVVNGKVILE